MKFRLEIELGNDAMRTGADVADALRGVAHRIDSLSETPKEMGPAGMVYDANGNAVGDWVVVS